MEKLIVKVKKENITDIMPFCDGIIVGINGLSVNVSCLLDVEEIASIKKDIYVYLNKNMKNSDLKHLEEVMVSLSKMNIAGVFFYDIAVFNINKRLSLNLNLIWDQEHFTTNFYTANYWHSEGVGGMHISSEITLNEINEIIDNTKMDLYLTIFGYLPMFNSFRHLVKHYLETFKLESNASIFYMEEKGRKYPIVDDSYGTTVYSHAILEGSSEFLELKGKNIFFILDSFNIPFSKFLEVLKMYRSETFNSEEIASLFENTDKGFFYKETIYKVKK